MANPRKINQDLLDDPEATPEVKKNLEHRNVDQAAREVFQKVGKSRYVVKGNKIVEKYTKGCGTEFSIFKAQWKTPEQKREIKRRFAEKGIVVEGL